VLGVGTLFCGATNNMAYDTLRVSVPGRAEGLVPEPYGDIRDMAFGRADIEKRRAYR
jgi:hypothetical protein